MSATESEKSAATGTHTGPAHPRRDGGAKVSGQADYVGDQALPGMLHAVAVGSTIARGRIRKVEDAAARAVPGVVEVISPGCGPRLMSLPKSSPNARTLATQVFAAQDPEVHHEGQLIAAVVGESLLAAREGARMLTIHYEEEAARSELACHLEDKEPAGTAFGDPPVLEVGDAEAQLAAAPVRVDAGYETAGNQHHPLETHATLAHFHEAGQAPVRDDAGSRERGTLENADAGIRLTVRDSTQNIHGVRYLLAELFGLKPEEVRILCPFIGGAFGCKGASWPHVALTVKLARALGRPVRLVLEREQLQGAVGGRSPTHQRVAFGAERDGRIRALVHEATNRCGTQDRYVEALTIASKMLYSADARRLSTSVVPLDVTHPTFMRAPAEVAGMFASESAFDELAVALQMDPIELRRRNEPDRDPMSGARFSQRLLMRCFDEGAEHFAWRAARERSSEDRREGPWRFGVGCATATYPAYAMAARVRLTIGGDGEVLLETGSHEMGGGTTTAQAQVAAVALGLPFERVRMTIGDTLLPKAPVSGGSGTTPSLGGAILDAVERLKEGLVALAPPGSPLLGVSAEELRFVEGRLVRADHPSEGQALPQILTDAGQAELSVEGVYRPSRQKGEDARSAHSFGANFCEVAVDEALGHIRVKRFHAHYSCGRILNAATARSQLLGGIIGGIGQALTEATQTDGRLSRTLNDGLDGYHVPVQADVPDLSVAWIDEPDFEASPIGAKGIGEISITGVSAAIANAVYDAIGRRFRRAPIRPEDLLRR